MRKVVVVGGARTPLSPAKKLFGGFSAQELGRLALVEALYRAGVRPDQLGEVILGCAEPPGTPNVARDVALLAQTPPGVPSCAVSQGSVSGLFAILDACYRIAAGDADVVAAGGLESASRALQASRSGGGKAPAATAATLPNPGEGDGALTLGQAAEGLAGAFGITRQEQDEMAALSRERADAASKRGRLREEMVAVPLPPAYDKWVREDGAVGGVWGGEPLARLEPFGDKAYGTVTTGNSAPLADGACFVILAAEEWAKAEGLRLLGEIRGFATAGVEPAAFGLAAAVAQARLLGRAGLSLGEVELFEVAELVAAQCLAGGRALGSESWCRANLGRGALGEPDPARVNVNGGGIALGHAQGQEGSRLVLTLLHELHARGAVVGVAAACAAGGLGAALLLERR